MKEQNHFDSNLNKIEFVEKEVTQLNNIKVIDEQIVKIEKISKFEKSIKSLVRSIAQSLINQSNVLDSKADAETQKALFNGKGYFNTLSFKLKSLEIEIGKCKYQITMQVYKFFMWVIKRLGYYD